jgi:uroporphyrinogen decarboxylase
MEQTAQTEGEAKKPLLRALGGEALTRPPVWLMRQAGRYLPEYRALRSRAANFLDFCYTPALAVEATLQPVRRFAMDAAILFSDILVVADALGQEVGFREGEGPVLDPIRASHDLERLHRSDVTAHLAPVYETARLVARALPPATALIGFAGGPWTLACYMVEGGTSRDFAAVKRWAFADAAGFAALIDRLVEATVAHLAAQVAAGAEAVQLFESWAGILPEAAFRRWVIAPTARIVAGLRARHPGVPVIGFPRGAGLMYRAYFSETGVTALGLDSMVPCGIARKTLQPIGPLQGNLDPVALLTGGAALDDGVERIVEALAGGPFIFNLGHGVLPETPPEHVARVVALLRAPPAA